MRFGLLRISRKLNQFAHFNGDNSNYMEYLYYVYRTNPQHLQKSWQNYFQLLEQDKNYVVHGYNRNVLFKSNVLNGSQSTSQATELMKYVSNGMVGMEVLKLNELVNAYRTYGHLMSTTDPLKLPKRVPFFRNLENVDKMLSHTNYNLNDSDLGLKLPKLDVNGIYKLGGTVGEYIDKLKERYCNNIAFEFGHLNRPEEVSFFVDLIESDNFLNLTKEEHLNYFQSICRAVKFEQFCGKAFPTLKRFGMDGIESLLVLLESIEKYAKDNPVNNIDSIMLTMSHRGRLNVLSNFLNKPLEVTFAEFRGANWFENCQYRSGDVKYHNGYRCVKDGVEIQMLSNSSHLQFSHPVLIGMVKAKQKFENDTKKNKILPLAIHGNSAISGQGMPYEVIQMSKIKGFTIGGTINIVTNNQIGFTANQLEASSSRYPTDVAKVIEAPVIHVNAYSIESVVFAGKLALLYRQKFNNDVYINLVGFRRFGHNELDMPKFTNAEMYSKVDQLPNLMVYYKDYLENYDSNPYNKVKLNISIDELNKIENETGSGFQKALDTSKTIEKTVVPLQNSNWKEVSELLSGFYESNLGGGFNDDKNKDVDKYVGCNTNLLKTGLDKKTLLEYGLKCTTVPERIKLHNSVKKIFDQRVQMLNSGTGIDTAVSEVLAFSSITSDGFHVRLTGQESKRGTFSHRHSQVQCQNTFDYYNVFEGFDVRILNSYLSELAAVGFEYGFSLYSPKTLNIWEAQFGDFVNGAQVILDSFVTSAETKWNYFSGMVMFLPHGYDGQGPDHSSCRVERFLQMSGEKESLDDNFRLGEDYAKLVNISVVNCSVSSNLFHVLRRQVHRDYRKPLICVTGKKLLKLRNAFSNLSEFETGTYFRRYIPDPLYDFNYDLYGDVNKEKDNMNNRNKESNFSKLFNRGMKEAKEMKREMNNEKLLDKVERAVVCTGQIYYDLLEYRDNTLLSLEENNKDNKGDKEETKREEKIVRNNKVILNRLEEITPFPAQWVFDDLKRFKNLKSVVWAQEEHENGGCYYFVRERFNNLLKKLKNEGYCPNLDVSLKYEGRLPSATTAVGDPKIHNDEQGFVKKCFELN